MEELGAGVVVVVLVVVVEGSVLVTWVVVLVVVEGVVVLVVVLVVVVLDAVTWSFGADSSSSGAPEPLSMSSPSSSSSSFGLVAPLPLPSTEENASRALEELLSGFGFRSSSELVPNGLSLKKMPWPLGEFTAAELRTFGRFRDFSAWIEMTRCEKMRMKQMRNLDEGNSDADEEWESDSEGGSVRPGEHHVHGDLSG